MTSPLSSGYETSSDVSKDTYENTIITKATDWQDDPCNIFDKTFEYCLKFNVFTVQEYNTDKYVMEHLDVIQDEYNLNIQYQLDVMKFIDNRSRELNSTS